MKRTITISLNDNLLEWIKTMIEKKEFASVSFAVQKAIFLMKQQYEKKEGN
jgi:Arc/MetJ-type ribon-helix-helix transcriptional regulator